jgi:hypothetical protein
MHFIPAAFAALSPTLLSSITTHQSLIDTSLFPHHIVDHEIWFLSGRVTPKIQTLSFDNLSSLRVTDKILRAASFVEVEHTPTAMVGSARALSINSKILGCAVVLSLLSDSQGFVY